MVQPLIASVRTSLLHGLQDVFFYGAVLMVAAIVPHLFLKQEPLRTRVVAPDSAPAVH